MNCVEYGYTCEIEFRDTEKSDEFYKRADELRQLHKITHSCVITTFDSNNYKDDIANARKVRDKNGEIDKEEKSVLATSLLMSSINSSCDVSGKSSKMTVNGFFESAK
ncbi:hypothetical protein RF11_16400 [Thelohanellus kitauei]|uniref:Uncharacterized protein n=1 Tax=Thelohanellus kitauei TaxID=669202 RepID=A0A0C2MGZ1_THEKT|nr:hypothetical protein RF11_16400 [Thelohanellus kitauei]